MTFYIWDQSREEFVEGTEFEFLVDKIAMMISEGGG